MSTTIETVEVLTPAQKAKAEPLTNYLESLIAGGEQVQFPTTHRFTPGLYSREIFMKAGCLLTSKIHKTEHQFVVSKGKLKVWSAEKGLETIEAPYIGITVPGTRRVLLIEEDTIWTTFHPTVETDPLVIEEQIIEPHDPYKYVGDKDLEFMIKGVLQ